MADIQILLVLPKIICVAIDNIIGVILSYLSGSTAGEASYWVAGGFMSASLLIEPLLVFWNTRQPNKLCQSHARVL